MPTRDDFGRPIDPSVVALARAIRKTESGGNYASKGRSGEYGAYQWMPGNYEAASKKYFGEVVDKTPVNQDKIAYYQILELKNKGLSPEEVASTWNSGSKDWEGKVGVNKFGVRYDVPSYVSKVTQAYLEEQGEATALDLPRPSSLLARTAHAADVSQETPEFDEVEQLLGAREVGMEPEKGFLRRAAEFIAPTTVRTVGKMSRGEQLSYRDAIGSALEVGSFAIPAGFGARALGLGARAATTLGGRVAAGAATGAATGATMGAGSAIGRGEDVGGVLGSAAASGAIGGVAGGVLGSVAPSAIRGVQRGYRSLFARPPASVDDAIAQVDNALKTGSPSAIRSAAERTAPHLSIRERWVGMSPAIKKRVAGKQDKMREYIDVTHARNLDDTLPTAYEYGSQRAQTAVDEMDTLLHTTGGKIGAFRRKVGTYKATPDDIKAIERSFTASLNRLNLEVRNGQIRMVPGTVTRIGSKNDMRVLQELYGDLQTTKQSPTLTNLIDLRSTFDTKVNFAKSAREVSNTVDPLARHVRQKIADTGAKIVGKSEAANLKRYSDFMDAYNDLRSYTDRQAGGEYLLRLVLSGRGGEARQVIQTIKQYTGIDLMDDATMMTLVTDLIGDASQKNLFRQEVTKAGLDAAAILTGDFSGVLASILRKGTDVALDAEKVLLQAAR